MFNHHMHLRRSTVNLFCIALVVFLGAVAGQPAGAVAPFREQSLTGANASVPAYTGGFQNGINFGWIDGWDNRGFATLAGRAGATSTRIKLPEWLLAQYGYSVEFDNGDMAAYQANGLTNLTAFLTGPTAAHSNAPSGQDTETYSPKNLYAPIWSSPGVVNPQNYWASYVYRTAAQYKGQVKIWEIWNEPDFTYNYDATNAWWTSPPSPNDLPNWHDSIYSYIRMLHVSYEVIKAVDPSSFVAIGGIGYESFLDAVLRYTDNPADGSVSAVYPERGGAYFDAVSYHYYPEYGIFDRASNTWLMDTDSDAMAAVLTIQQNNMRLQLHTWGYDGKTYPLKLWISTETGVASKPVGNSMGGSELQRNYIIKMLVTAQANQISQVHWYQLFDTEADSVSSDSYAHMGLYYDLAGKTLAQAQLKPSALAYKTVTALLRGQSYDAAATSALNLDPNVRGYVFRQVDGRRTYVVWAKTVNNSETASANLMLPSRVPLLKRNWDYAGTSSTTTLTPANGTISLALTGTPVFLTETMPFMPTHSISLAIVTRGQSGSW